MLKQVTIVIEIQQTQTFITLLEYWDQIVTWTIQKSITKYKITTLFKNPLKMSPSS